MGTSPDATTAPPAEIVAVETRPDPGMTGVAPPPALLADWLSRQRQEIDDLLARRISLRVAGDDPGRLVESMRYSLLAPGKRLRPILALAAANATGSAEHGVDQDANVRIAAAAIELVHCYSLIHDDLPAMDDDDFRRGKPSNHRVFGEATAILAGDALLTLAFEWLAEAGLSSGRPAAFGRAALALARGAGMAGMVRGQARDLGEEAPVHVEDLERLHGEKTAALFRAAVEVGAAAAGASVDDLATIGVFGYRYGIAFQHADDLDDGDHPIHAAAARQRLRDLVLEATSGLAALDARCDTRLLRELAGGLVPVG
jgi:geranylgeranyl diphosphate synthase type II